MFEPSHANPAAEDATTRWIFDEIMAAALDAPDPAARPLLLERSASRGMMAPLHRRSEGETYRVVDGRVTFFVGDEQVVAAAGDVVAAPAGSVRTFRVESESARWLVLTRVVSLPRLLDFNRAVAPAVGPMQSEGWSRSQDAALVAGFGSVNGIDVLGAPGTLPQSRDASAVRGRV